MLCSCVQLMLLCFRQVRPEVWRTLPVTGLTVFGPISFFHSSYVFSFSVAQPSFSVALTRLCILVRRGSLWRACVWSPLSYLFIPHAHIPSFLTRSLSLRPSPFATRCQTCLLLDSYPSRAQPSPLCQSFATDRAPREFTENSRLC